MSATAILPSAGSPRSELLRWAIAGALVLMAHVGVFAGYWLSHPAQMQGIEQAPAVIIDLAPLTVAPTPEPQDLAPGPPTPPPQPEAQPLKREAVEPPKPDIAPKIEPAPVAPLVTLPEPKPPAPPDAKPKTVEKLKEPTPPPPKAQTAPPKSRHVAPAPAAARAGSQSTASVAPSWISQLLAHLNRYKRRPENTGGEQGVVILAFTVNREGRVLAHHIARSSGTPAFDAEALAMLRRAEPLPPFPDSMSGRVAQLQRTDPVQSALNKRAIARNECAASARTRPYPSTSLDRATRACILTSPARRQLQPSSSGRHDVRRASFAATVLEKRRTGHATGEIPYIRLSVPTSIAVAADGGALPLPGGCASPRSDRDRDR